MYVDYVEKKIILPEVALLATVNASWKTSNPRCQRPVTWGSQQTQPVTATDNNDYELETANSYDPNSFSVHNSKVEHNVNDFVITVEHNVNDFINLLAVNLTQAYYVIGLVSGVCVSFMLDTGAPVSLLVEDM